MVTRRAPGTAPARPASWSCGTWLAGPPARTRVGAVIAARPARQAGSGAFSWASVVVTTSQSKGSGPAGRGATGRGGVEREEGRGLLQDQAADQGGLAPGEELRGGGAHRVGDDGGAGEAERLQEAAELLGEVGEAVAAGPVAEAVAAQVHRVHPVVGRQFRRDLRPGGGGLAAAVDQDDGRGALGARGPVGEPYPSDGDLADGGVEEGGDPAGRGGPVAGPSARQDQERGRGPAERPAGPLRRVGGAGIAGAGGDEREGADALGAHGRVPDGEVAARPVAEEVDPVPAQVDAEVLHGGGREEASLRVAGVEQDEGPVRGEPGELLRSVRTPPVPRQADQRLPLPGHPAGACGAVVRGEGAHGGDPHRAGRAGQSVSRGA